MVQDTHMTDAATKADVVFPLAFYPEIDGTIVNTERRLQRWCKAVTPPFEFRTAEIAQGIAEALEGNAPTGSPRELYPNAVPGQLCSEPVLFVDGFGFPDKKAKLQVIEEAPMFEALPNTCRLINEVEKDLPRPAYSKTKSM